MDLGEGAPSEAIVYWLPLALIIGVIVVIISFVRDLSYDRTVETLAFAGVIMIGGFFIRSFHKRNTSKHT